MMLSLARQPQSQIGSLRFNENGSTSLANRPLLCADAVLESEGVPKMEDLYSSTGQLLQALQNFRAASFEYQPNAAYSEDDCRLQMSYMILRRSLLPKIVGL